MLHIINRVKNQPKQSSFYRFTNQIDVLCLQDQLADIKTLSPIPLLCKANVEVVQISKASNKPEYNIP